MKLFRVLNFKYVTSTKYPKYSMMTSSVFTRITILAILLGLLFISVPTSSMNDSSILVYLHKDGSIELMYTGSYAARGSPGGNISFYGIFTNSSTTISLNTTRKLIGLENIFINLSCRDLEDRLVLLGSLHFESSNLLGRLDLVGDLYKSSLTGDIVIEYKAEGSAESIDSIYNYLAGINAVKVNNHLDAVMRVSWIKMLSLVVDKETRPSPSSEGLIGSLSFQLDLGKAAKPINVTVNQMHNMLERDCKSLVFRMEQGSTRNSTVLHLVFNDHENVNTLLALYNIMVEPVLEAIKYTTNSTTHPIKLENLLRAANALAGNYTIITPSKMNITITSRKENTRIYIETAPIKYKNTEDPAITLAELFKLLASTRLAKSLMNAKLFFKPDPGIIVEMNGKPINSATFQQIITNSIHTTTGEQTNQNTTNSSTNASTKLTAMIKRRILLTIILIALVAIITGLLAVMYRKSNALIRH